ncbi:hypothetical protein D3C71_2019030 [compost metagenome]
MTHEVWREYAGVLLLAELGGDRLQLLDQRVAGVIAGDRQSAVVDDFDPACRVIIGPGADVPGFIGRDVVEPHFQQTPVFQSLD